MLKLGYADNKNKQSYWLIGPRMTVGSQSGCDVIVAGDGVAPHHAEIMIKDEELVLLRRAPAVTLLVNGKPVEKGRRIKVNDSIVVGDTALVVTDPKVAFKPSVVLPAASADVPASAEAGWSLKANHPTLLNKVFTLKPETLVGRAPECDISLSMAHLSRRHAILTIEQGALYVRDMDSSNGTFLNGKRITEARVRRGDELRFDVLSFGVMGPADELDKTSIRPAAGLYQVKPESAPAQPAKVSHTPVEIVRAAKAGTAVHNGVVSNGVVSKDPSRLVLFGMLAALAVSVIIFGALITLF